MHTLRRQRVLPDLRAALEVHHASWLVDEAFDVLRKGNVALCFHDAQVQPVSTPVTADFVYVRRHGTRARYGGSYTDQMLRVDAESIAGWLGDGLDVCVYFNNDGGGAAVRNARRLRELLEKEL